MTLAGHAGAAFRRMRSYDRTLMLVASALFALGVLFSMATSPVATASFRIDQAFYFAGRHAAYAGFGVIVMLAAASLEPRSLRRLGTLLAGAALLLCAAVAMFAPEVKGARRWIDFGLFSFQPSELLKPTLVVFWAWMLGEAMKRPGFPGRTIALGVFGLAAAALVAQPDVGQTALLAIVLGAMLILSGLALRWMVGLAVAAALGGWGVYAFIPHARQRIDAYLNPEGDGGYQVGRALDAIAAGGAFGRGPGEGVIKRTLPDAHADFVYAAAAEEFGLIASLGVIALFGLLAFRGLSRAARLNDPFEQLAAAGLIVLIVAQALIHIAVNLSLIPAKGMTLPLISFGGSSMAGAALALGFCLSLLRERPGAFLYPGGRP